MTGFPQILLLKGFGEGLLGKTKIMMTAQNLHWYPRPVLSPLNWPSLCSRHSEKSYHSPSSGAGHGLTVTNLCGYALNKASPCHQLLEAHVVLLRVPEAVINSGLWAALGAGERGFSAGMQEQGPSNVGQWPRPAPAAFTPGWAVLGPIPAQDNLSEPLQCLSLQQHSLSLCHMPAID